MSLLPQRILAHTVPLGHAEPDGRVMIDKNWWLLLYNICAQTVGTGVVGTIGGSPGVVGSGTASAGSGGLPSSAVQELAAADADATDADAISLRLPLSVLAQLMPTETDPAPSLADVRNALIWGQDGFLADPVAAAQPTATITVGASPFTYTAPFNGQVSVTGGTVSLIQIIRQGTTVATGLITGVIPVSRTDQVKVTHTGAPTMVFLPT